MKGIGRLAGVGLALGWLLLAGTGCATPRMGRYDVRVTVSDSMADSARILPSVEVHLLALDPDAGRQLQTYSMTDYWNPNRKKDEFVKRVLHFGQGKENPQTLSYKDPIWDRWDANGAEYLFVLADLPGLFQDKEDVKDPRRVILPLHPERWNQRLIRISIEKGGVYLQTPPLPVEKK